MQQHLYLIYINIKINTHVNNHFVTPAAYLNPRPVHRASDCQQQAQHPHKRTLRFGFRCRDLGLGPQPGTGISFEVPILNTQP